MKYYRVIDDDGVVGQIVRLDDGRFPCPVCGWPWPYPAMTPVWGELEEIRELIEWTYGDSCDDEHGCGVEFGIDLPDTFRAYKIARIRLLNKLGWPRWLIEQIEKNLGISEEELRREAAENPPGSVATPRWNSIIRPAGGKKLYQHWLRHQAEFAGDIANPIDYATEAIRLASQEKSAGPRRVLEGVSPEGNKVRVVWDRAGGKNNFAIATLKNDGGVESLHAFHRFDRATLEAEFGLRDTPNEADVFDQYFHVYGPENLTEVVYR